MWCSICQWLISAALDGDKPLGRVTTRHVQRCPRCRQFWQASAAVDLRLRMDTCAAPPARRSSPGRVLPLPGLVGRGLLSAAALAAIILLAIALGPPGTPRRIRRPVPDPGNYMSDVEKLATAPAKAEMNHLAQDAQDAAKTLLSYLPTNADQITGKE